MKTARQRIREALKECPGTSTELAAELDLPVRIVSAHLHTMARLGHVRRDPKPMPVDADGKVLAYVFHFVREPGDRMANLYHYLPTRKRA